jgi:peptidoglycan/LPS O-acetylase OafA/YrhL
VFDPALEMRRLAGKVALLLAGIYVLVLFVVMVGVSKGTRLPVLEWVLLPLPAFAFGPAVVDAVRLHRTADPARMKPLWRRSLALAVLGSVVLVAEAMLIERMS